MQFLGWLKALANFSDKFQHFLPRLPFCTVVINDDSNHKLRYNANKWHSLSNFPANDISQPGQRRKTNGLPPKTMNNEWEAFWAPLSATLRSSHQMIPFDDDERFLFNNFEWMTRNPFQNCFQLNWYKVASLGKGNCDMKSFYHKLSEKTGSVQILSHNSYTIEERFVKVKLIASSLASGNVVVNDPWLKLMLQLQKPYRV